jgi:hypothetical protein
VYLKRNGTAYIFNVFERRRIVEIFNGKEYSSYEYKLEDNRKILYDGGNWFKERDLESSDGS